MALRRTAALLMILAGLVVIAPRLRSTGPGYLGVQMTNLPDAPGILILKVLPDSPAEKAGLRRGDVLTAVDGKLLDDRTGLAKTIAETEPDTEVTLTVLRRGEQTKLSAVLAKRPKGLDFRAPEERPTDEPGTEHVKPEGRKP